MARKLVAPRIQEGVVNFYQTNFKTLNAGAEYALEAFPYIYRRSLAELRGVFLSQELKLIIDTFKDAIPTTGIMVGLHLVTQVEDRIDLKNDLFGKWDVDEAQLIEKLKKITNAQAAALEIWAVAYWQDSQQGVEVYISAEQL